MRDYMIGLGETAIRPEELRLIPWRDIVGSRVTVDGSITKNSKSRKVPLSPAAQAAIARMREIHGAERGPFHWATENVRREFWDTLRSHLKWMDATTIYYTFRHTRCSRWANDRRIPIVNVMRWMGHSSLKITQGYIHPLDEADDFAGLVSELCGKPQIAYNRDAARDAA
jgi:integrase